MYFETTEESYTIKRTYTYRSYGRVYHAIIFYREGRNDYGIALNYNFYNGTWEQGIYGFKTETEAIEYLKTTKESI